MLPRDLENRQLITNLVNYITGGILCGPWIYLFPGHPVHVHVTDDVLHDQHARRVLGNQGSQTHQDRSRRSCCEYQLKEL